ncbi:serine/threonine-protein kinase [Pseudogemmatithrix spongiicola]|uniref:non-specific serine/threonine protein kinase n=1 Tax=Pseudogemmatithrix spongiicola TaxID=3062599 RepID=A0AA49Q726_9BACT|nr:serine/threonine-protein kinase [Gemmatimonadaceae bacterium 'strain 138']WKW16572.1 serine/threonine-protein kinase [Gemmatimonadaceae bacterium 'strain 318']
MERLVEDLASRYRVEHEIGRGGWGVVYRARDLRLPRTVALKVLRVDSADPDARERFRREIDFEARLVHPHIIPVIESGEVDGALYFVMPYVEGSTLRELLTQSGPLPIADALRITRQICEGLAHAHERQIVHRDIKPANILLASGNAMIADFGIARALDSADIGAWTTGTGLRLGTPAYMSPEQSAGDPELDHRSDLYSLGCVLFEMLVGQPPFAAAAYATVLGQHAVTPAPAVRSLRAEVPPRLDSLVARLLAKQPAERFQSARELIAAIDAALAELQAPPAEEPTWRRSRIALAAVVALAVVGTIALTSSASRLAAHRDSLADTTRVVLFPFEGDASEREAATELLRRAFARWDGVALVDAFQVDDAIGDRPLSSRRAGSVARDLGAGRFIRGSVVRTDAGLELRAVLSSAGRRPITLAEYTERLPAGTWVSRDSLAARAVASLLFRGAPRGDTDLPALRTASVEAAQLYLAGRGSLDRWALDTAATLLDEAWRRDPKFTEAALWLSLVRFWRDEAPAKWLLPAQAVAQDSARATNAVARRHATALLALTEDNRPKACVEWEALTATAPLEFSGWYSAALCRDRDNIVLRDPSAPTGWRFRSSFHTAQLYYLRAFQQLPTMHHALRDRAYERVRGLLFLSMNRVRTARVAESGARMIAFPMIDGDSLVLAPIAFAQMSGADTSVAHLRRRSAREVVRQQRELFRDITSVWTSAAPQSA